MDKDLNGPAETVVGPSVKIQGDLNSEGNIKIEGQVAGKVKTSQSVFIIPGAKISADVVAGNVIVGGEVAGNLKVSGHLVLQSTAKILGDIACSVLGVEDGALFSGKCTMALNDMSTIVNGKPGKGTLGKKVEPEIEPEE